MFFTSFAVGSVYMYLPRYCFDDCLHFFQDRTIVHKLFFFCSLLHSMRLYHSNRKQFSMNNWYSMYFPMHKIAVFQIDCESEWNINFFHFAWSENETVFRTTTCSIQIKFNFFNFLELHARFPSNNSKFIRCSTLYSNVK